MSKYLLIKTFSPAEAALTCALTATCRLLHAIAVCLGGGLDFFFPEMLHLTKAATVKKVNYLTEMPCGDTLLLQHREKLQKNSFFEAFRRSTAGGSHGSAATQWFWYASASNRFLSRCCCIFPCKERVKKYYFQCVWKEWGWPNCHVAIIQQRALKTHRLHVI